MLGNNSNVTEKRFTQEGGRTANFERHRFSRLDETDDLLVDAGRDGVPVDADDLVSNLEWTGDAIKTEGCEESNDLH